MPSDRIYLDNQATTPTDPAVLEAMLPYYSEDFGNPHSDEHYFGWQAFEAVEEARLQVASLINADKHEIIFTSGATESVNLALQGIARASDGEKKRIVTVTTEHSCVLQCCDYLETIGFEVIRLPVKEDGLLDMQAVAQVIDEQTLITSVMLVNNEIGVIQPLEEIAKICQQVGSYLHSDATQAIGKIPVDVDKLGLDLLSMSGHKLYGPKGIGALYLRKGMQHNMSPLFSGGGQEKSLRPGTLPVPLMVGLGTACSIVAEHMDKDTKTIKALTDTLEKLLSSGCPDMMVFGSKNMRVAGNLSIGFPGIEGAKIVAKVGERLAISTGSACSSAAFEPSHVLLALGLTKETASSSIRISIGRMNTEVDVEKAAMLLLEEVGIIV